MKITKQNKHQNRNLAILLSSVAAVLLIAAATYLTFFNGKLLGWQPFPTSNVNTEVTTQDSEDTNHGSKGDSTGGTDKTTDQIPVSETLTATITTLSQANGSVTFSGSANDEKSGGSCSITFTNPNDRPVTRSVDTTIQDGKAVCGPVQIPETEFSFLGEWTATFRYFSGDTQAVTEKKVIIQ